ncbi:MAG: YeiH family protein [Butyrivibrio sp.]|nr:YeiH family protein [Butyrivibrio sp.]
MNLLKKWTTYIPGFAVAIVIAAAAKFLESLLPIPLVGASVIAMFIGMIINNFKKPGVLLSPGIKFTSKKILKFAIILLGASLNIATVLTVGRNSLLVMVFTLATCFGLGYISGKLLNLNWKMSNLISAGTGICGGSAIAAIAPVIDAEDLDIAFGLSATFLFDMAMIVLFPIFGKAIGLDDVMYGLWAGTAVNDTSSVVAAGFAFSEAAGNYATMVKLTRTLAIIPTVIIFALINMKIKKGAGAGKNTKLEVNLKSVFPWFILGFLLLSCLNSFGFIPAAVGSSLKEISKFLMVAALAAIGLNTSFTDMKKAGPAPMLHGFIVSALVVIVSISVIWFEKMNGML